MAIRDQGPGTRDQGSARNTEHATRNTQHSAPAQSAAPAYKGYCSGTHRLVAPAATIARVRPFLPVMGITRVANVTGLDALGIPVVMVCRPNSRSLAVAQGKGLDLDAAQASGLMESIESYHAEQITLPLKLASYEELRYTHRLVEVEQLPRTSTTLFHPYRQILWIAGDDLLHQEPVWVPYETVHLNFTTAMRPLMGSFGASSSGLASGNHLLEAISHAICELVERDAFALWNLRSAVAQAQTRVDLATVADAGCRIVLDKYARAGIAVAVWETTSDIGIPAFYCRIVDRAADPLRPLYTTWGLGCHPERAIALLRALTEAAQSRLTLIAGARDDLGRDHYVELRHADALQDGRAQVLGVGPARPFAPGAGWQAATFDEDVAAELDRLRAAGLTRVIVVDLTKREFRLPVVRVLIPGLEPLPEEGSLPGRRAQAVRSAECGVRSAEFGDQRSGTIFRSSQLAES